MRRFREVKTELYRAFYLKWFRWLAVSEARIPFVSNL